MFQSTRTSVGTDYTPTAALVIMAILVIPALLFASGWPNPISAGTALTCSATLLTLAWFTWTRASRVSVVSIISTSPRSK